MKLFSCDSCGHTLYFENVTCESCGHRLGYEPQSNAMLALEADGNRWVSVSDRSRAFVFCENARHGACNWLITSEPGGDIFCLACRHNETIPNLDNPANLERWQVIERAKKRLFYSLIRLDLPLQTRAENPQHGLSFRFLADEAAPQPVMTGHEDGIITIALAEADDAERESRRSAMGEPYRTLLGHFRHEIGHHFWDLLVDGGPMLDEFRAKFGDERADYGEALKRHYSAGPPTNWQASFISSYATSHAWEDFAETWAHYLHVTDTTEMAAAFGVRLRPRVEHGGELAAAITFDPYTATSVEAIVENWVPLSILLNNLNRAMGLVDAYPFVLTGPVVDKLGFIHRLVHQARPH
jgi:hypothetical protein